MAVLFCLPLGSWGIFWQSSAHFQKQLQVLPETLFQILPDTGSDTADEIVDNQYAVAEPSSFHVSFRRKSSLKKSSTN